MDEKELEDWELYEQVKQLIDEESKDIDIAYQLYGEEIEMRRRRGQSPRTTTLGPPQTKKRSIQFRQTHKQVRPYTIVEEDEPEDFHPRVLAAMMHAEEIGLHMGSSPDQLFSYLFKEKAGVGGYSTVDEMSAETEGSVFICEGSAMPGDKGQQRLSTNLFSENVGSAPVAGEQQAETSGVQESSASVASDLEPGIDYFLKTTRPRYSTHVQIRGSVPPDWFPGYVEVSQHQVRLNHSPSKIMQRAWNSVRPEEYSSEDIKCA